MMMEGEPRESDSSVVMDRRTERRRDATGFPTRKETERRKGKRAGDVQ